MKDCAFVEISILSEEKHIYNFLKIRGNTACELFDNRKYYIKINGNKFLKVLEHYKKYVADYATKATNDMLDLCNIKFEYNEEIYNFSFDYNNSELLELATKMYKDFKDVIAFNSIEYEDIEWNIIKGIKDLPLKTQFVLDDYFKKYGIISKDDKNWLYKRIEKQINDFVEIKKKPFKPKYLCESIKI